jgi:two-component system response regulator GlrR
MMTMMNDAAATSRKGDTTMNMNMQARTQGASRVLVVDDDPGLLRLMQLRLEAAGYGVTVADSGERALAQLAVSRPRVVVTDLQMGGMDGIALFEAIRAESPALPVIILTAHGTIPDAVAAVKGGVFGYLTKPFDARALLVEIERALAVSGEPAAAGVDDGAWRAAIITRNPSMEEVLAKARLVAAGDAAILIQGESGTGKELLARAIHNASPRRDRPFVAINCAAIPATLLESELFGHERGAFTGAEIARAGRFEQAHGGTLLLDEIGEMSPDLQAKLLRVLQGREVTRLGGGASRPFDVRVIAATNVDLESRVAAGEFREDLYYRLNVLRIDVPPLRERAGDVWLLAKHFLERERESLGRHVLGFSPECAVALEAHNWPGNVRELENVVRQAALRARGDRIRPADLQFRIPGNSRDDEGPNLDRVLAAWLEANDGEAWDRIERLVYETALSLRANNQVRASKLLGVSRNVLRHRMEKYSL